MGSASAAAVIAVAATVNVVIGCCMYSDGDLAKTMAPLKDLPVNVIVRLCTCS